MRRNNIDAALGLFGCAGQWRLAKIQRAQVGWRVTAMHTAERREGQDNQSVVDQLLTRLAPEDRALPIAVVLEDHAGLYRKITAPKADAAVLDKVVAAQVETMLPGKTDPMRWGWCRSRESNDLWVHAVTQRDIDGCLAALPGGVSATVVITDTMALLRPWLSDGSASRGAQLVLSVGSTRSALALVHEGQLSGVVVIDGGHDVADVESRQRSWSDQLRDACDELLGPVPQADRPKRCRLACPCGLDQPLTEFVEHATGLTVDPWEDAGDLVGVDGRDAAAVIAAGAAAACLDPVTPMIRLSLASGLSESVGLMKRRVAVAALWLIIALAGLYLLDRHRAGTVADLLADGALDTEHMAELDMQIALGQYLELSGPIPLAILDEVGQLTENFMIDSLTYERGGGLSLEGVLSSGDAIGKLTADLAQARTLSSIQLQSQTNIGKDKVRFDITADPSPRFFGAFVEPKPKETPKTDEAPKPDDKKGADS